MSIQRHNTASKREQDNKDDAVKFVAYYRHKRTPGVKNLVHIKLLKTSGGLGYVHKAKF